MSAKKRAAPTLGEAERAVLRRVSEARASYLHETGRDLTWPEIERAMGWSQPTASTIKHGKRAIRLGEIPALARVLGVREAWLAVGEGPMRPDGDAVAATPSAAAPPPPGPVGRLEDELTEIPPPSPPGIRRHA